MKDKKKARLTIFLLGVAIVICVVALIVNSLTAEFLYFGKYILIAVAVAAAVGIAYVVFRLFRERKSTVESAPSENQEDGGLKKKSGIFSRTQNNDRELIEKYEESCKETEAQIQDLEKALREAMERQHALLDEFNGLSSNTEKDELRFNKEYDLLSRVISGLEDNIRQCEGRLYQMKALIEMQRMSMLSMKFDINPSEPERSEKKMSQAFISYRTSDEAKKTREAIMRNISESRELWSMDDVEYSLSEGADYYPSFSPRMNYVDTFDEPVNTPKIRDVEFSALSPKKVERGDFTTVEIVAYEDDWRFVVDKLIENADSETRETIDSPRRIADDTMIKVVLSSPHIEIEDDEITQQWVGRYLVFRFNLEIPEDFDKKKIKLVARVYFNDVIATNLSFIINCEGENSESLDIVRKDISSAFMSYASEDRAEVVSVIQGMKKVRPDLHIFFDVDSLRSGEDWKKCIMAEIEKSDVLYLCWSQYARESIYVEAEWKYALSLRGVDSIEPIPLVPPSKCPPPKELDSKHFNDRMLYYRN